MFFLFLAIFAFVGATLRYFANGYFAQDIFSWSLIPLGTLVVNVIGSFALGGLYQYSQTEQSILSPALSLALMVGLLGALTTFSGYAIDTLRLAQAGNYWAAGINALVNPVFSILFCFIGLKMTS